MPDSDPCASLGLRNEMLYCYRVISATPPGQPGSMVQSENRSNGSLWIIVYFWIGGNGIIDFDFFDGRDYLEQSGRTQNKGCFIPMPGLRLKIFDSRFYSSCILYLSKHRHKLGADSNKQTFCMKCCPTLSNMIAENEEAPRHWELVSVHRVCWDIPRDNVMSERGPILPLPSLTLSPLPTWDLWARTRKCASSNLQ